MMDQMNQLEKMNKYTRQILERIRCATQPNKAFRTEEKLWPTEIESDRMRFAMTLKEAANSGAYVDPNHNAFLKKMAEMNGTIDKIHEKSLKQVQEFW